MSGATAGESQWRPLRAVDKPQLAEARLQAHYAVQWLARAARAYIPPQPDDGHTSLRWDHDALTTQPFKDGARLSLRIADLTLALHDGNGAAQSVSLAGRTDREARAWLGERLAARGLDAKALDAPAPYEIPAHALAGDARYDAAGSADALAMLAAWYANAHLLLERLQRQLTDRKLAPSPVACWPHHFDLAILLTLPKPNPEQTGYVGAGLSPGDDYYDEPYFYVSVYPKPDPATLPSLPALAHWHSHDFTAAVATAHRIVATKNQRAETDDYLQGSVDIALELFR